MVKQDEQKYRGGPVARRGRPVASIPARFSASRTRAARNTRPLLPLEGEEVHALTEQRESVPETIRRRQLLIGGLGLIATTLTLGDWLWNLTPHSSGSPRSTNNSYDGDQPVRYWSNATLATLCKLQSPLPVAARALAIVHTCMFDAWTAYDATAVGTRLGAELRQPADAYTLSNKREAMSYAAYCALLDLFPGSQRYVEQLMIGLNYDPSANSTSVNTPVGIGNLAARAVLDFRHNDGSNQLGNLRPGAYADYTHYQPLNTPENIVSPDHWQPLNLPTAGAVGMKVQQFACAHWVHVTPFAIAGTSQFVPRPGPARVTNSQYTVQAQQILQYSAQLNDEQKAVAEYWSTAIEAQLLARWFTFAHAISQSNNYTLDQSVKLYFSLANAALDASIACWACKRTYDAAYPMTAIHYLFNGKQVRAWAGPDKDVQWLNGQYWLPYRPGYALAPTYPEYCSEQSAFSAAAAEILRNFTQSDSLGATWIQPAHSSSIELNVPAHPVTLSWPTLTSAVEQAGTAGLYGGIHFAQSDLDGRLLGRNVARQVWRKAQSYINGQ